MIHIHLLERYATTASQCCCIRITWGIINIETSDTFLEGLFVIERQSHCDPHQNYYWCDALAR